MEDREAPDDIGAVARFVGHPLYVRWMTDTPVRQAGQKPRTARIDIRTTPEAVERIQALAEKEQRTFSDMVRILLARGLERS